ncbi:MAG: hypothetical protein WHS86_11155 [Desulfosoma sp.]
MIALYHLPKRTQRDRRSRRMASAMAELSREEGWRWMDWREAMDGDPRYVADARVFLMVVAGFQDLEPLEPCRDRLRHLKVAAAVLAPDEDLILAVQSYSPCFIALSDADDAAVPEVLKCLSRETSVCAFRERSVEKIYKPRRAVP